MVNIGASCNDGRPDPTTGGACGKMHSVREQVWTNADVARPRRERRRATVCKRRRATEVAGTQAGTVYGNIPINDAIGQRARICSAPGSIETISCYVACHRAIDKCPLVGSASSNRMIVNNGAVSQIAADRSSTLPIGKVASENAVTHVTPCCTAATTSARCHGAIVLESEIDERNIVSTRAGIISRVAGNDTVCHYCIYGEKRRA